MPPSNNHQPHLYTGCQLSVHGNKSLVPIKCWVTDGCAALKKLYSCVCAINMVHSDKINAKSHDCVVGWCYKCSNSMALWMVWRSTAGLCLWVKCTQCLFEHATFRSSNYLFTLQKIAQPLLQRREGALSRYRAPVQLYSKIADNLCETMSIATGTMNTIRAVPVHTLAAFKQQIEGSLDKCPGLNLVTLLRHFCMWYKSRWFIFKAISCYFLLWVCWLHPFWPFW